MQTTSTDLLYLDSEDVSQACREVDPLGCVAEALTQHASGTARVSEEAYLPWQPAEEGAARTLNMPGLLEGDVRVVGTKIINANTANPSRGLPRASGLILLFDPVTARVRVIMEAAEISALRTAAVSALSTLKLQASRSDTLAVIGAGKIARTHLTLMLGRLSNLRKALVYDREPGRAAALVAEVRETEAPRANIEAVDTPEEAISQATVLVTATNTTVPYILYGSLRPGALVVNVSLDDVHEDAYRKADRLYVDDWDLVTHDQNRLLGKLARAGVVAGPSEGGQARKVDGTLGQLLAGECPGRDHDRQIILVNPFGMAIEDLALAHRIHEVALQRGFGRPLPS